MREYSARAAVHPEEPARTREPRVPRQSTAARMCSPMGLRKDLGFRGGCADQATSQPQLDGSVRGGNSSSDRKSSLSISTV